MPGFELARIYGVPLLLPGGGGEGGLFTARLSQSPNAPVFRPLGLGDLLPQALRGLRGKALADSAYPRTGALAAWLGFCLSRRVLPVSCPELFLELIAAAHTGGKDILFITATRGDFQEFRRQVGRMFPGIRLTSHLEAATANERPDDSLAFMAKVKPWAVYLGPDLRDREALAARLVKEIPSVKCAVLGGYDFELYTRPATEGSGLGVGLALGWSSLRRRPMGVFRLAPALLAWIDALRVKLFNHYKLGAP